MLRYFRRIFNLKQGAENPEIVIDDITRNINFRGSNLWILACAIFIASIGLNVNSTAVIIGAMLISPLMGPIVGAGFALGVYDFQLFKKSIRNLLIATVVSLIVSTAYFFVSPFKDIQSELLARTAPNIYDVLIAFCGGIVGVIALTRVEKGNPIPGVAIATALMPPLCTAGYGLATGNISYFLGAFYLYSINCTFIAVATFFIVKYLKYPAKEQVDQRQQRLVKNIVTTLIIIMLVPSSYLAWSLYAEQAFRKATDTFIDKEFLAKGYIIVFKKSNYRANPHSLDLAFLSHRFTKPEIDTLSHRLQKQLDQKVKLTIRQDSTDRLAALKGDILNEISFQQKNIAQQQIEQQALLSRKIEVPQIYREARALFPQISSLSISEATFAYEKDSSSAKYVAILEVQKPLAVEDASKFSAWIKQRMKIKNIEVFNKNIEEVIVPEKVIVKRKKKR